MVDNAAFDKVSAWILMHEGKQIGKVLWVVGGTWKCSIITWKKEVFGLAKDNDDALNSLVIGSAGGGGYDKRSASFESCLDRNGINTNGLEIAGRGEGAIRSYLSGLGIEVIEAI